MSDTLYGLGGNDRIYARAGNDKLYGGDGADAMNGGQDQDEIYGGNGDDTIQGGNGSDTIYGGLGRDVLIGGDLEDNTSDTFVYKSITESQVRTFDIINHFESDFDKINLEAIDADVSKAGNQAFVFSSGGTFSGRAGEIIAVRSGDATYVSADVDGDMKADFLIKIFGVVARDNFIL